MSQTTREKYVKLNPMKIAVINTPFATHVGRMAHVFASLQSAGHEIELWGSGATEDVARRHQFTYREIPLTTDFVETMNRRLKPHEIFTGMFFQLAKEQLPTVLDFCERYSPDVIEANARVFSATVASRLTDIPVVTHCCSGHSFSQIPEDLYGYCANGTETDRQRSIMLKMSREFFKETDDWFETHIGKPYKLGRIENAIGLCSPEFAIAQTIDALSKPRIAALPNVKMTGPVVLENPTDMNFSDRPPYCYMSLGTSPWNPEEIIERYRVLAELVPRDLDVVIGLGGLVAADRLAIQDERVTVLEHAPQIEAIRHAEFVVCHGGCQTVHEALYFGKPIIGIPHHAEINEMVNSVEQAGAGVRIAPAKLNQKTAESAFEKIVTDEVRAKAANLAPLLQAADGHRNALDIFEKITQKPAGSH